MSSAQTVVFKFVLPAVMTGVTLWLAVSRLLSPEPVGDAGWAGVAFLAVFAGLVALHGFDLKRVRLEASSLIVSNYRREVTISLRDVVSARQINLPVPPVIELRLNDDFGLAGKVRFLPADASMWLGWMSGDGEVVTVLRAAMMEAWERPA